ncbi:hypothetical protein DAPPUDRAFT_305455 [Daphnia pulex]|uniref:Uncharacterized protein n=1 Tax=Daphnia pulex TaxID=6669 RepID=E9FWP1_DAPPU|nr:hypothetical protein DAPPUDRAFT_305455 [Daphnia pulex]|eukprot:EFX87927.1 hypothetical protein DAPPUDRAFT_305455 [Daphnia pulex]
MYYLRIRIWRVEYIYVIHTNVEICFHSAHLFNLQSQNVCNSAIRLPWQLI